MKVQHWVLTCFAGLILFGCGSRKAYQDRHFVLEETYVHKYGMEVQANEWHTRGKSGQVISQLDNGIKITRNYADGILNGESTFTFPHSDRIERVEVYNSGNLDKVVLHDHNGHPERETQFKDDGSLIVTSWYEGGAPRCRETYQNDYLMSGTYYSQDGKVETQFQDGNGLRMVRNSAGELMCHENVMGGCVVRRSIYYQNGAPKEVIPICNGQIEGIKKTYLSFGEPSTFEEWSNNMQHGKTTLFRGGEKYAEVPYVYGKKHGVERRYRDGNAVVEELTWENDLLHGPYHTYLNGNVKTEWYFYGDRVSKASFDVAHRG